jgi:hypothetical protein
MSIISKPYVPKDITRREQVNLARWRMENIRETKRYLLESRGVEEHTNTSYYTVWLTTVTDKYKSGDETETLRLLFFLSVKSVK